MFSLWFLRGLCCLSLDFTGMGVFDDENKREVFLVLVFFQYFVWDLNQRAKTIYPALSATEVSWRLAHTYFFEKVPRLKYPNDDS